MNKQANVYREKRPIRKAAMEESQTFVSDKISYLVRTFSCFYARRILLWTKPPLPYFHQKFNPNDQSP